MSKQMTSQPDGVPPSGYRLPAATHPGAVRLQVGDLDRSLAYYGDVLGLRTLERASGEARLGVFDLPGTDGAERTLIVLVERRGARAVPRGGVLGLYHFAIRVPDRASLARFVRHLAALNAHAGMSDHEVSEAVYLTDPDGLGIEVYADRPEASWRHENRQLVMTTRPIDLRDLLAAAPSAPWTGMPAGTVMGHIHLHVGDLDAAAAFYHSGLGFDKTVWAYPGALFLSAGGYHHHLGTNTWSSGPPAAEDQARLLSWDLVVPQREDTAAAARSLVEAGYTVADDRDSRASLATDPWGTTLRIVSKTKENG